MINYQFVCKIYIPNIFRSIRCRVYDDLMLHEHLNARIALRN